MSTFNVAEHNALVQHIIDNNPPQTASGLLRGLYTFYMIRDKIPMVCGDGQGGQDPQELRAIVLQDYEVETIDDIPEDE